MTQQRTFTKLDSNTKSGRIAVLARVTETDPWVQVESILGTREAERYADELENDDEERSMQIRDLDDEAWGDDAPRE